MTGHELAGILERTAAFVREHKSANGLDLKLAGGVRITVVSVGAERVRRHRDQSKHPDDPLQHGVTDPVTKALQESVTPAEVRPPPHPLPALSGLNNSESFPEPEVSLSESSDLDLTGSARVTESVTRTRAATRTRKSTKWTRVPSDWQPRTEERQLARDEGVTFERELADFRDHEFKTPRQDADATFRRWLRRAGDMRRANGKAPGLVDHERRPEVQAFRREPSEPKQIDLQATLAGVSQARAAMRKQ